MTEAEWLVCEDPEAMLECISEKSSGRKLRLFGCACCRRVWHLMECVHLREAIEAAEAMADGVIGLEDLLPVAARALDALAAMGAARAKRTLDGKPSDAERAAQAAWVMACEAPKPSVIARAVIPVTRTEVGRPCPAQALHDLLGNPFRPVSLAPSCRTGGAVALAQAAYAERRLPSGHLDIARLAVLSDALEEGGCTDEAILSHLRSPGPHVRGCWALDLVLGKA